MLSTYNFIPSNEKKLFKSRTSSFTRKKGDYLLFDGDVQNDLFLIKSGITCLFDDKGEKLTLIDFSYCNKFAVDIESFYNQTPSNYCIKCLDDCEIDCIRYDDLQSVFNESQAIERSFRLLEERVLISLLSKSIKQQTLNIEERFVWVMNKRPELFKLVQHKYIAAYISIDPTNFSKLYNKYCVNGGLIYQ